MWSIMFQGVSSSIKVFMRRKNIIDKSEVVIYVKIVHKRWKHEICCGQACSARVCVRVVVGYKRHRTKHLSFGWRETTANIRRSAKNVTYAVGDRVHQLDFSDLMRFGLFNAPSC